MECSVPFFYRFHTNFFFGLAGALSGRDAIGLAYAVVHTPNPNTDVPHGRHYGRLPHRASQFGSIRSFQRFSLASLVCSALAVHECICRHEQTVAAYTNTIIIHRLPHCGSSIVSSNLFVIFPSTYG